MPLIIIAKRIIAFSMLCLFICFSSAAHAEYSMDYSAIQGCSVEATRICDFGPGVGPSHLWNIVSDYAGVTGSWQENNGVWGRTIGGGITSSLVISFAVLGHESAHAAVANELKASNVYLDWRPEKFWKGEVDPTWKRVLSSESVIEYASAGIAWQNRAVDSTIAENLDSELSLADMLWLGINQAGLPLYVMKSKKPESGKGYGSEKNDIEAWIAHTSGFEQAVMDRLYGDLAIGAGWQAIGTISSMYAGLRYLLTGKEYHMGGTCLNPQASLTNVGVLYTLGVYHKLTDGVNLHMAPGYGKNRVADKDMLSIALDLSYDF
ncbi:MAG: hypothetical protein V1753_03010 [Pseudomonadota bacterium]